jgi:hypothetical protein
MISWVRHKHTPEQMPPLLEYVTCVTFDRFQLSPAMAWYVY